MITGKLLRERAVRSALMLCVILATGIYSCTAGSKKVATEEMHKQGSAAHVC
jgi:hypothetical protein